MLLNKLKSCHLRVMHLKKLYGVPRILYSTKIQDITRTAPADSPGADPDSLMASTNVSGELFPATTTKAVPMLMSDREPLVLPFHDVPGPISLKTLSKARNYLSKTGTQLTAGFLILLLNLESLVMNRKPTKILSALFEKYGPIVRFVTPVGTDIVLTNHPYHIQQVFSAEGENPMRSLLDSLQKFRMVQRNSAFSGLYNMQGEEWARHRKMLYEPLQKSLIQNLNDLEHVCDNFVEKTYNCRNFHDEMTNDLYKEVNKWAFDCMGYLIFSKKFTMLNTEIVYSQCDMSWLYHALEQSTDAVLRCESGLQMWKVFPTVSWRALLKNCEVLDNLIGKFVLESEQKLINAASHPECTDKVSSLMNSLLIAEDKLSADDICTVLMDMLLLGVNTVSSSMSFLLYYLAKHQKVQRILHHEVNTVAQDLKTEDIATIRQRTPYLQACIKETLRLSPPIPILTRVLQKNIVLDKYNIPRGTLIFMSIQDASLKESNFDDASRFNPSRWLSADAKYYNTFASIPFGFGYRKCLGQNVAETMLSVLTFKIIQKFKLEYHYGDIRPTNTFISKPNKPLKIRFVDRI